MPATLVAAFLTSTIPASAQSQQAVSPLQATLDESSRTDKFTFVVFHRDNGTATDALYRQTQAAIAEHSGNAVITSARVDDSAEQALVNRFGIGRAPMPMTVVVAPNGAVTGLFPRKITAAQVSASIVPPTMMRCMKELQAKKLVFVCLSDSDNAEVPAGVQSVMQLPEFKDRMTVVGMRLDQPAESRFYKQMRVDSSKVTGPHAVLIAPPGVLIGHFTASSSADAIAAAIHKAGQCCDDANCRHNRASSTRAR
ncbi:hypothetical protein Mal4_36890 [Maioricimonas rarisocia]|uniref:Thioredoxin domain-containing protein n=1 Tax=Maioricimonas rarisocia TaxID=2528026 RepID=A0A517ZA33_9PLAN|nr:hypothetical protein Mal4_36890 [Maioricimonas rarisocia]